MHAGDWLDSARVTAVYSGSVTTSEEERGRRYVQKFQDRHAARIDQLMTIPGIGAYILHWFLGQSGGISW